MKTKLFALGALFGGIAVGLGAFGAHGLQGMPANILKNWEIAVRYQFWHALVIMILALTSDIFKDSLLNRISSLFTIGIIIFSGSLYCLALGAPKWLGAITPIGGIGLILGWATLIYSTYNAKHQ